MKTMPRVSLALALSVALAAPSALAAKRQPPPPSKPTAMDKTLREGAKRNESAPVGKGDTEFGFSFLFSNYDEQDTNQVQLTASVGKFISDRAELSIEPTITYFDSAGSTSFTLAPFVAFKYLFRGANLSNPVVPYVGAGIGIDITSTSGASSSTDFGLFVAPVAGLKYFVSERVSLEYALSFNFGILESCDVDCFGGTLQGLNNALRFNIYY